jgi:hypothetical protein
VLRQILGSPVRELSTGLWTISVGNFRSTHKVYKHLFRLNSTTWLLAHGLRLSVSSGHRRCFVGNVVGENRSQTIGEGSLLRLGVADHGRIVNDGTGLSGRVHAGAKGISVHFRYRNRFAGEPRDMPLGAWPRESLAAIRQASANWSPTGSGSSRPRRSSSGNWPKASASSRKRN